MKYLLRIEDCAADGEKSSKQIEVTAEGAFSRGNLNLGYTFDGSAYSLAIGDSGILHERVGDINMKMEFAGGRRTFCRIQGGGYEGGFYVFTHSISINLSADNCKACVEFSICDGENSDGAGEHFIKRISARPAK